MKPELSLGTAQFGLTYGITNKKGKIDSSEILKILKYSKDNGIKYIDTAQAYGEAEKIIGNSLPKKNKFLITSKLPPIDKVSIDDAMISEFEKKFQNSLIELKQESLDIFLLHRICI